MSLNCKILGNYTFGGVFWNATGGNIPKQVPQTSPIEVEKVIYYLVAKEQTSFLLVICLSYWLKQIPQDLPRMMGSRSISPNFHKGWGWWLGKTLATKGRVT